MHGTTSLVEGESGETRAHRTSNRISAVLIFNAGNEEGEGGECALANYPPTTSSSSSRILSRTAPGGLEDNTDPKSVRKGRVGWVARKEQLLMEGIDFVGVF